MHSKEGIYKAFAQLIYAVVMADGVIKEQEKTAISHIVKDHPLGIYIQEYFLREEPRISVAHSFLHTMEVCRNYGKDNEYTFLLAIVEQLSKVSEGLEKEVREGLFHDFIQDFKKRFVD